MLYLKAQKSERIRGEISMPPSKTHSFRALILASLADGVSTIRRPKISTDWHEAIRAMRMYGAQIEEPGNRGGRPAANPGRCDQRQQLRDDARFCGRGGGRLPRLDDPDRG